MLTNCSNNDGPWQFPEKLIPLYGDGLNVRDWLYLEDHVDALLQAACRGELGRSTCVGGSASNGTASERTNEQMVEAICSALDALLPAGVHHSQLITPVTDRPSHDRRYAIDPSRISTEQGWQPRHSFQVGLAATVTWTLEQHGGAVAEQFAAHQGEGSTRDCGYRERDQHLGWTDAAAAPPRRPAGQRALACCGCGGSTSMRSRVINGVLRPMPACPLLAGASGEWPCGQTCAPARRACRQWPAWPGW